MIKRTLMLLMLVALCGSAWSQGVEVDVYVTDYMGPQEIGKEKALGKQKTDSVELFAAPGEYEPFSFALQPKDRLPDVMIKGGELKGPAGVIPAANVRVQSVEGYHGKRQLLMDLGRSWNMAGWSKELFWVTVHVPDDAKPGVYKGVVTITSANKPVKTLNVSMDVLPVKFDELPFYIGWHYSWPGSVEKLRAQFKDMQEHGCTNVGPLYGFRMPINDDDTSQLNTFITEYLKAGFTKPIMFASPMGLSVGSLTGYGPIDSKRFQQKYIEVMRKLYAETSKHDIPIIYSIGDEFTNKGIKGVVYAGKLAKLTWEELPEIITTCDCNGYMEVMAMAPYLYIATFNNGWDGIDHHNKGRQLINEKFIRELTQKTRAIPYFVNAGKGRFPFGFFFWKMSKLGVIGKVEWYYCLGNNSRGSVVRVDGTTVLPTTVYEMSREGLDDLKYVVTLENLVARAKKTGKAKAEAAEAEKLLKALEKSIIPNWTAYSRGGKRWPIDGMEEVDPNKAASIGSFNTLRRSIADHIIKLRNAMK